MTGFSVDYHTHMKQGNKYVETSWRKTPAYQGGFLLDSGVHTVAALRLLLGDDGVESLSSYTSLSRQYLAPVDTVTATLRTKSGTPGVFLQCAGASQKRAIMHIMAENGSLSVDSASGSVSVVHGDANEDAKPVTTSHDDTGRGIAAEHKAWAESLLLGKPNPRQVLEQALADLENLEKMLNSGEADGKRETLQYQKVSP